MVLHIWGYNPVQSYSPCGMTGVTLHGVVFPEQGLFRRTVKALKANLTQTSFHTTNLSMIWLSLFLIQQLSFAWRVLDLQP